MTTKTEKIGVIVVDTGRILLFDPFYASDLSPRPPRRLYKDTESGKFYEYGVDFKHFTDNIINEQSVSDLIAENRLVFVPSEDDFSVGSMTENLAQNGIWQAKFEDGTLGKAVALAVDDGIYDVVAEYEDTVLKKISVVLS